MSILPLHFDREVSLLEALKGVTLDRLQRVLSRTLGHRWQIIGADGVRVLGTDIAHVTESSIAVPLRIDIDVAGQLVASDAPRAQVEAAGAWIEMLLAASSRYRMASDIHLEAMHADFETLQRQHAALQASESKYRELSEQLNQRVQSQVDVIDKAQRQLYQAEKMASIGSLAAGMAHEINNPIGFIRSNLATASRYVLLLTEAFENMHDEFRLPAGARRDDIDFALTDFPSLLKESMSGADRIARIVANLKAFANVDCLTDGDIDMNEVVQAATTILADQLPSSVVLKTDLQPLPHIPGDRARLNQALFAIMQNARQALDERGGVIRVTSCVMNNQIHVDVHDSGHGIRSEILSRIFDPFFTTRDVGSGTGLGLTVSRDIIAAHQGHIAVHSIENVGTTFTIVLPIQIDMDVPQYEEDHR